MAFWCDSGSARRNKQVDPWHSNPEHHVLSCARVVKQLSSNEAKRQFLRGNEPLQWPMKRELGGRVYANIVDDSW
eukprot:3588573-Pyramimonas_sp.AAC.1